MATSRRPTTISIYDLFSSFPNTTFPFYYLYSVVFFSLCLTIDLSFSLSSSPYAEVDGKSVRRSFTSPLLRRKGRVDPSIDRSIGKVSRQDPFQFFVFCEVGSCQQLLQMFAAGKGKEKRRGKGIRCKE